MKTDANTLLHNPDAVVQQIAMKIFQKHVNTSARTYQETRDKGRIVHIAHKFEVTEIEKSPFKVMEYMYNLVIKKRCQLIQSLLNTVVNYNSVSGQKNGYLMSIVDDVTCIILNKNDNVKSRVALSRIIIP